MGTLFSKFNIFQRAKYTPPAVTSFSWDRRRDQNTMKEDFVMKNLQDCVQHKPPGSINGQQYLIENCSNCKIFILDYTNTVIIDECNGCTIVLGPVKRSIFIRDCANCRIIVACEQFRLRDCTDLQISLFCATRPIIESCKSIRFACFQFHYRSIQDHFKQCNLNIWNNLWYKVHDYTPANKNDESNWMYANESNDVETLTLYPEIEALGISTAKNDSAVPVTTGVCNKANGPHEHCLVVFCNNFAARLFLTSANLNKAKIELVKSREAKITKRHAESLFLTSILVEAVQRCSVIGLHMYGENAIQICNRIIQKTPEISLYYVSPTSNMASHQVNTFFSIADLPMECYT